MELLYLGLQSMKTAFLGSWFQQDNPRARVLRNFVGTDRISQIDQQFRDGMGSFIPPQLVTPTVPETPALDLETPETPTVTSPESNEKSDVLTPNEAKAPDTDVTPTGMVEVQPGVAHVEKEEAPVAFKEAADNMSGADAGLAIGGTAALGSGMLMGHAGDRAASKAFSLGNTMQDVDRIRRYSNIDIQDAREAFAHPEKSTLFRNATNKLDNAASMEREARRRAGMLGRLFHDKKVSPKAFKDLQRGLLGIGGLALGGLAAKKLYESHLAPEKKTPPPHLFRKAAAIELRREADMFQPQDSASFQGVEPGKQRSNAEVRRDFENASEPPRQDNSADIDEMLGT